MQKFISSEKHRTEGQNTSGMFGKEFWKYCTWALLLFAAICLLPFLFTLNGFECFDFRETGQIGDTIGGTMGPFVAIIAGLLTFLAFWVQYKANEQQRNDLSIERFENTLFQMMTQQEEITDNLRYSTDASPNVLATGRHVFEFIYLHRQSEWHTGLKMSIQHNGYKAMTEDQSLWCLDHYFRHLYRTFKWVSESAPKSLSESEKYGYAAIVRSMLSEYELVLIYYNALAFRDNQKFKLLIEKFSILDNLRFNLLARQDERDYYTALREHPDTLKPESLGDNFYARNAIIHE